MDENSVHTSVVIKLPDEKEPDGVNTYKIDLEDVEAPREYVIDQLFCDEDLAVYAVFEASDFTGEKSHREVTSSNFGQFKFSKKYYKKKKGKSWSENSALMVSDKEPGEPWTDQLNLERNLELSDQERNYPEMSVKLSKGVNTDINQCPKLLEEVRKAVSLNFSKMKTKNSDLSSIFSVKSLNNVREMMSRGSSTTFVLDEENRKQGKKTPPNIVIVPVIIKEGELGVYWKDYKGAESPDRTSNTYIEKVSISTNTEFYYNHNEVGKTESLQNDEKAENSQEYLLEEIKNLQEKFNILVKSLESTGFTFPEKKKPEDGVTKPEESKPVRKSLNKFDEIPVFSSETKYFPEAKNSGKKITYNSLEEEIPLIASNSESFIKDFFDNSDRFDDYDEEEKSQSTEMINWEEVKNPRRVRISKSESNNPCSKSKSSHLKKSLSMDLGEEVLGLKKLKNIFVKLESLSKKEKNKAVDHKDEFWFVDKLNEAKLHDLPKLENVKVKLETNHCTVNTNPIGLLKNQKNQLNKSEKEGAEKTTPNRANTKINNADLGDVKDVKVLKKGAKPKTETKNASQEEKQNARSVTRRVIVKDSPQSKLHVDLLMKNQNTEQKNNTPKGHTTRLPRVTFQKKDQKTIKKDKKVEPETAAASSVAVKKSAEPKETKNQVEGPKKVQPRRTPEVVVELFSKKPSSIEDFYSEIDLQCLYNYHTEAKENPGCGKRNCSTDNKKPVVKSVWALTKLLLYEDGTKKMEVLEASLNPPDYSLNQNLTEDKIR